MNRNKWALGALLILGVLLVVVGVLWPRTKTEKIVNEVPVEVEKIVKETATTVTPTPTPTPTPQKCNSIHVDLKDAPEGVWSNASGLLLAEGWCAVIERDQSWQQTRDETELRKTWEEGATRDYLLICNPGPGSRFYSLQDEYGGRPRNWWNDQAKKAWFFCLPNTPLSGEEPIVAVLYEHDDKLEEGWEFPILPQEN